MTDLSHESTRRTGERRVSPLRGTTMPITAVFLFLFVVSAVLLAESSATYLIATALGVGLAVVFVLELATRRGALSIPGPLIWAVLFVCFCIFQMIWSPASIRGLLTLVQLIVLAVIIVSYGTSARRWASVEYALYSAVILTFIYNLIGDPHIEDGRVGSTLLNANAYAFVLLLGALFAMRHILKGSLAHSLSKKALVLLVLFFGLCLYGIIFLTISRKGIIFGLAATVILVLYWLWQQPVQRRMILTVVVVVLFTGMAYGLYRSPEFSRITQLSSYLQGSTSNRDLVVRGSKLGEALDVWLQHPAFGVGFDEFRVISGGTKQSYSFNNYAELLANHGLVGFFTYVMIYVSAFVSLLRSFRRSRDGLVSAEIFWALTLLGVLVAWDMAAVTYTGKETWIAIGLVVAVAARARGQIPAEEESRGALPLRWARPGKRYGAGLRNQSG